MFALEFFLDQNKNRRIDNQRPISSLARSFYNEKVSQASHPTLTSGTRNFPASFQNNEIIEPIKRKKKAPQKVKYLKEVKRKPRRKQESSLLSFSWPKVWFLVILVLVTRLSFMERGIIDYYNTLDLIASKNHELKLLKIENQNLIKEIHQIKVSPSYQKKLAREHLGVIAKDEYLILFAKDQ